MEISGEVKHPVGFFSGLFDAQAGSRILLAMLFMVIERFKHVDSKLVGERFRREGRMLPEGVKYHASWVDAAALRCFQVVEAPKAESLAPWVSRWNDLVDFEIIPVVTSADFWSNSQ